MNISFHFGFIFSLFLKVPFGGFWLNILMNDLTKLEAMVEVLVLHSRSSYTFRSSFTKRPNSKIETRTHVYVFSGNKTSIIQPLIREIGRHFCITNILQKKNASFILDKSFFFPNWIKRIH